MQKSADAEQAKSTGGMVALYPTPESAAKLLIPGGEPIEDLHLTLGYLGEDVRDLYSSVAAQMIVSDAAEWTPVLTARVFAHATFNPDEYAGREPCGVYLVGDNKRLPNLYAEVQDGLAGSYELPEQHTPWIPHITAGYGLRAADLSYVGSIDFDLLVLKWAGEEYTHQLAGVSTLT